MSTFKQVSIPIFPVTAYPPASSYKLYSYVAGTTTKQATYTDSTGNTQNANPATIQAGSSAPVYLTVFCQVGQSYKFVLAPSTDTDPPTSPLWTVDNLQTDDNLDLTPYASISNSILTLINTSLTNPKISTKILDLNGNTLFTFTPTLAAINNYAITNQITGVSPTIQVSGDTNRNARLLGAGTGGVNLGSPSGTTPLILEPGSTTNTQSHTMTLTSPRTVAWPDTNISQFIVQEVNTETGAVASGSTAIPLDDTIPQNTEGDQVMTLSITPKNASNLLLIDVVVFAANSANAVIMAPLFQDSTASAIGAGYFNNATAGNRGLIAFRHKMTAGTTNATTFKVRLGSNTGTTTFNGQGGSRELGGVLASSINIREISP